MPLFMRIRSAYNNLEQDCHIKVAKSTYFRQKNYNFLKEYFWSAAFFSENALLAKLQHHDFLRKIQQKRIFFQMRVEGKDETIFVTGFFCSFNFGIFQCY